MKGVIFTEFIELVEQQFSLAAADELLERSDLPSGGVYTSVGTYESSEMTTLVSNLSAMTGVPVATLLKDFGGRLFRRFVVAYPEFFVGVTSSIQFLSRVDGYVHMEVRKLYPDAELPSFSCEELPDGSFTMTYRSSRNLADLAEGMIEACLAHFGGGYSVRRTAVDGEPSASRFTLTPAEAR